MPRQQPESRPLFPMPDGQTIVIGAFRAYALAFLPWLRKGSGIRAYRLGLFTLLGMAWYGAYAPCEELLYYTPLWLLAVLCRRRDTTAGSAYMGNTIFRKLMRGERRGRLLEPVVVGGFGLLLCQDSPELGLFLIGGAVCLLALLSAEMGHINRQRIAMRDAEANARMMMGIQRGGDGFQ